MSARRLWLIALALLALAGAFTLSGRLARGAAANRERIAALHVLAGSNYGASMDQLAWDAGWSSLCQPDDARPPASLPIEALPFVAATRMERGDYAGALEEFRRVAAESDSAEATLASAYVAALEMRWLEAAELYPVEPTARQRRFWATVFYLAAQDLMFRGQSEQAAQWYRRADAGYDRLGPYLGLPLMECLAQQGQVLEAFDAYRRGLVVLPVDEALAHRERFEQMRLEALRAWRDLNPDNTQVAGWLEFYENDRPVAETETLAEAPQPQVALTHDLSDGRRLIGFDYRPEDIETGSFMWVDLYVQEGVAEGSPVTRLRRPVLNQAPNGSFVWDAAPDGVRPFGWHGLVYLQNLDALHEAAVFPGNSGQCMDAVRIGGSFGLQSLPTPLDSAISYIQGGQLYAMGPAQLSLGRQWYGVADPYNYSYVGGRPEPDQLLPMAGIWERVSSAAQVAVWLLTHSDSRGCFNQLYLFPLS
jgi:tetratricopeptide (TPR) repeat protein